MVNRTRLVLAVTFLSLTHLLMRGELLPTGAAPDRWLWLGLSGIIGLAVGDALYYQSLIWIGPGLTTLLMALAPIFGAFQGWLLLGEQLSGKEVLGIAITMAAVALVIRDRGYKNAVGTDRRHLWLGILTGVGAALGQATGLIASKMGLTGGFDPLSATLMRMLVAMAVIWAYTILRGQLRATATAWGDRKAMSAIAAGAAVGPFAGVWLSLIAVQNSPVGVASTLMSLAPILILWPAKVIFGEHISRTSVLGTLLALVGVVLLILH
jgi:drug/metabolite transporter (DMT)-like permease